jgi:DNA-binding winged helix-turn-helix (wHTH) protein
VKKFITTYFNETLDLNIQSFNLLGFTGMAASILVAIISLVQNSYLSALICLALFLIAFALIRTVGKKISYRLGCWIVVITVFFLAFPALFFMQGGYQSGMPSFFIFAVIYTTIMLDKTDRTIALIIELVLYIGCCLIAFYFPNTVAYYFTETEQLLDVLTGLIVSGVLLMLIVLLQIRMYHVRQMEIIALNRKLKKRNEELVEWDKYREEQAQKKIREAKILSKGTLTLYIQKTKALVNGRDAELTPKEFAVLLLLVKNEEKELTAKEIYEKVWGMPMNNDSGSIRRIISILKKKLDDENTDEFSILTKYGGKYIFTRT